MERIVVARSATLTHTFTFTPTGTPSVTVTRADGSAVTVGSVSGAGTDWSYTIPASSNTLLDTLTETWTATTGGQAQTFTDIIEVAGGTLFTLEEFQAMLPARKSSETITNAQIADVRTLVEQALEDACDVAFVPRYYEETVSGTGTSDVMLRWPRVRAFRSVSIDGADVTPLSSVVGLREGIGYLSTSWTFGRGNVVVAYEHGHDTPPMRIKQAALVLAKEWLLQSPVDSRATSISNDDGTFALTTPGLRGSMFGIPEVDAACQQYSLRVGVA